jgi:DNA-binding transcriptional LysR family regulator
MTQPAFSQQIKSLEQRLGVQLVDRTTRRVDITTAGQALVPEARSVVEATARLRKAAERQAHALSGRLIIGALEAITAVPPVPALLEELRMYYDLLEVEVRRLNFADYADALFHGEVDVALGFLPVAPGIQVQHLFTQPRVACMASSDPLAAQGPLTLAQLSDRPYIGRSPGIPENWQAFWAVDPRPDGRPVRYTAHRSTDVETALTAIGLGEGIEFPPASARHLYARPGVAYVDVTDLSPCTAVLAWLPKNRDQPLVAAIRKAAHTILHRTPHSHTGQLGPEA